MFSLCDLSPLNDTIPTGLLFVVLRSYFDAGNQADSREYDTVSLAVVSGTVEEWQPFERDWKKVLEHHHVDYLHTTYAISRHDIYEGWGEDKVNDLLSDCSQVACNYCVRATVGTSLGKFGLMPFIVTINLKDFVNYARENPECLQNADEGCLRQAVEEVLLWAREKAFCEFCHFFFDQGEPYYGHLVQWLQNKRARKYAPFLDMIVHRSESDMRHVPALQLADLYAWTQNNRNSKWSPEWKQKLIASHFQWQWIDKTNIGNVRKDHEAAWKSLKLPARSKTK